MGGFSGVENNGVGGASRAPPEGHSVVVHLALGVDGFKGGVDGVGSKSVFMECRWGGLMWWGGGMV